MKTNLRGAGCFQKCPEVSVKGFSQIYKFSPTADGEPWMIHGGHRYITNTNPATMVMNYDSDQPYHLHPQRNQTGEETYQHNFNPLLLAQDAFLSTSSISTQDKSQSILPGSETEKDGFNSEPLGENLARLPDIIQDMQAKHLQEHQPSHHHEGRLHHKQQRSTKSFNNNKKGNLLENVVERNKITLGQKTAQPGSYMMAHAIKQTPHSVKKVHEALEESLHSAGQEDISVSLQRLQRKTQQMHICANNAQAMVNQKSKAKQASRKEQPCLSLQKQLPLLGITATHEEGTGPLPTKIHLNFHINNPSHLLLPLHQTRQDAIFHFASFSGHCFGNPVPELCLEDHQLNQGGQDLHHPQKQESSEKWQRWDPKYDSFGQLLTQQQHIMTPRTSLSEGMSCFPRLPPIGDMKRGNSYHAKNTAEPVQRYSSDGYLLQMEKQRQMQASVNYKAEKIKRQTLHLKGIDNQNKRISRIPIALTKDSEGKDKKVPRIKALEYAKTIAKPTRQSKQRQTRQCNNLNDHAQYVEGLDTWQLANLDFFKKRHEEEKQAVALYRKLHDINPKCD